MSSTAKLSTFSTQGFAWASSGTGEGGGYSHVQTPNLRNCWGSNQDTVSPNAACGNGYQWGNLLTAKSNHPGGVNMLFLDGSVKFIKNSVNIGTYARTRHQGGRRGHRRQQLLNSALKPEQAFNSRTGTFRGRPADQHEFNFGTGTVCAKRRGGAS